MNNNNFQKPKKFSDIKKRVISAVFLTVTFLFYLISTFFSSYDKKDINNIILIISKVFSISFLILMFMMMIYELTISLKLFNPSVKRERILKILFISISLLIFLFPFGTTSSLILTFLYRSDIFDYVYFRNILFQLLLFFIGFVSLTLILIKTKVKKENVVSTLFLLLLIIFGMKGFLNISLSQKGITTTLWVMLTIIFTDTFAYFVGTKLGKNKMAPQISPKKSWEGFIGGVLISFVLMSTFTLLLFFLKQDYRPFSFMSLQSSSKMIMFYLTFTLFMAILSQIGDLLFSYVKRLNNIKDFSDLIAGHGGILDRFDSFLTVFTFTFILTLTI